MKLYHYHNIETSLKELKGTFHLSSPNELNDPLESFVTVYWEGDKAAWEGLFRNYICSLSKSIEIYLLQGDMEEISTDSLMVDIHAFDSVPMGNLLKELSDTFLNDEYIVKLAELLGSINYRLYRNDVKAILQLVHQKAFYYCLTLFRDNKFIPSEEADPQIKLLSKFKEMKLPDIPDDKPVRESLIYAMLSVIKTTIHDAIELQYIKIGLDDEAFLYGKPEKSDEKSDTAGSETMDKKVDHKKISGSRQHRNWLNATWNFPENYLRQLLDMMYPPTYITCFSASNTDSSMWGTYADSHKGICFEYSTNEKDTIDLIGSPVLPLKPVQYDDGNFECNFFTTFGRLTFPQIKTWLTGKDSISECYEEFSDVEKWRDQYWKICELKTYHKMTEWAHEQEYRIAYTDMLMEYKKGDKRLIKYNPKALTGIIFGIRTSEYDKMQIMKAVEENGPYENLKFYQAEYNDEKRKIEVRPKEWKRNNETH